MKVLILEEDREAAEAIKAAIRFNFPVEVKTCSSVARAQSLLKSDISIKALITTYEMQNYSFDRCHQLALFAKVHRPDVRQMGIGTYEKRELIIGKNKVLLADANDIKVDFAEMLCPKKIVSLERRKQNAQVISLFSALEGPYDV